MRKTITAVAALALALAGCSAPAPAPAPSPGPAPATVPSTTPSKPTPGGFIAKKVGEQASITNQDGSSAVDFWITKITVDPKCLPYMQRKPGMHTILIDVTVQTHTSAEDPTFTAPAGVINPFALQTKGEDGVSNQAEFGACTSTKSLPTNYAPNSKYTGQIEVESTNPHGSLLMTAPGTLSNTNGWEWKY